LYTIRNDEDVAHYSLTVPELGALRDRFVQATGVFKEAFAAYMKSIATIPAPER
jgi:hypothetical protein